MRIPALMMTPAIMHSNDPTRPIDLFWNAVDRNTGQRLGIGDLTHEASRVCGRSCGNLSALSAIVGNVLAARKDAKILIMLTDLNVCRAVNRAAAYPCEAREGLSVAPPHPCLAPALAEMERVVGALVEGGGQILASFDPHRCCPDPLGHPDMGEERLNAVRAGCVVLYPSANPRRPGCVEVRYLGKPDAFDAKCAVLHSRHERFIDYGFDEAVAYARFAASVGDLARLHPLTLATVDPQVELLRNAALP